VILTFFTNLRLIKLALEYHTCRLYWCMK